MKCLPLQRAEKILLASTLLLSVPALILGWIYEKNNELPPAPRLETQGSALAKRLRFNFAGRE